MLYRDAILEDFKNNKKNFEIARKIYLSYPTYIFKHNKEDEFKIKDEISKFFGIQFRNIHIVGSAKTGESFVKKTKFIPSISDLDIAIIDLGLFFTYLEKVFKATKGYRELTRFDSEDYGFFQENISKGIFKVDLMPICFEKRDIIKFFNELSSKYSKLFDNINVSIYASECFFEAKQGKAINKIRLEI